MDFKTAKIQCWMLTGDKGDTAKMIGIQCGMLSPLQTEKKQESMNTIVADQRIKTDQGLKEGTKPEVNLIEIHFDKNFSVE